MGRYRAKEITKVITLSDCHLPHNIHLGSIREFIQDWQPDQIILLGDFLNLDPISHWMIDKKRLVEGKRLKQEYDLANYEIELLKQSAPEAKIIYAEGNHENWIEQYIDKHPEMEGLIELQDHIKGIDQWIGFNEYYKIGKLYYKHGTSTTKYHTNKSLEEGINLIYGHTHDIQEMTAVTMFDKQPHKAKSIGCLCSEDMPYMKKKPNKWVKAFNYAYIRENGTFNDYTVVITNGKFTAEGKTY